jgi:tetratricopeptide (TPR) repeat protein
MTISILHQAVSQMDLLEAAEAALPHLQGEVRDKLERCVKEMSQQVVLTTWCLEDFADYAHQAASLAERQRALYHLHKYYDAAQDFERLEQYLSEIVAERSADVHMKVLLKGGDTRLVPAKEVWQQVYKLGTFDTAQEAAAEILGLADSEISSVDTEVHYRADGTPIQA